MIQRVRVMFLTLLLSAGTSALGAGPERVSLQGIEADIAFLADDLLEGRAAGTRGYDLSARYVAARMRGLGLEPAFGDSWFQEFPLVSSRTVDSESGLTLGSRSLSSGSDFVLSKNFFAESSEVTAPLVMAGFGIRAPELDHDDYAGLDVSGRIVVLFSGAPPGFPKDQRAYYSSGTRKARQAAELGAVGILTVRTRVDEERVAWERVRNGASFARMRWLDAAGRPHDAWESLRGAALLNDDVRPRLFAKVDLTEAEALDAAADGRAPRMDLNMEAAIRTRSDITRTRSMNVGGLLPGSDANLRDEWVVITAHLDGLGIGPEVDGDAIYNGAYDNASGIAFQLELARLLSEDEAGPARSVLFLAVGAEEKGLLGSDYFARHPPVAIERIVANANMDMAVMTFPIADLVAFGAEHSTLGDVALRAAEGAGLRLAPDPMPEEVIFIRSDQFSFVKQGVPAIYLDVGTGSTDPSVDGETAVREFLTTHYHQPSDDLSRIFHGDSMVRFTWANYLLIREVADTPAAPRWRNANFFGETFGPDRVEGP